MKPRHVDTDWMRDAACTAHPRLGWLQDPHRVGLGETSTMRVICSRCPVFATCETYVHAARISGGFWAGRYRNARQDLDEWTGDAA